MDNVDNRVVKSGIWYTIGNFLVKGMGFITTPFFARLLTKGEYGDYSNYIAWLTLIMMFASCCLYVSVNKARFDFAERLDEYISTILLAGTFITAILYVIVCIWMSSFEELLSMDSFYIHSMFIYLLFEPAIEVFQVKQRIQYKYKSSVALSLVMITVTTATSVILVLLMKNRYLARVTGYIIPLLVISLSLYTALVRKGRGFKARYLKYAFGISWPFVPHSLAHIVLSTSDRIMITNMCGSSFNAVYTLAYNCTAIAVLLMNSISNAVCPWLFEQLEGKRYESIRRTTLPFVLIFALPVLFCVLLAPEILWIMGGDSFMEAKYIIAPLMVSVMFQFVSSMYVNIEQYYKKTWCIASGTAVAAGLNIVLNFLLIPRLGYQVAAYTTLAGYAAMFLIHFVFASLLGYTKLYKTRVIIVCLTFSLAVIYPVQLLYDNNTLRYVILAGAVFVALIFAVKYKKGIKSTYSELIKKGE